MGLIRTFSILFCILFQSLTAFASEVSSPQIASPGIQKVEPEKYRWLYELLISAEDRNQDPAKAFKSFKVHMPDSNTYFPHPDQLKAANLNDLSSVQGKITYIGFLPKRYQYDVLKRSDTNEVVLSVKIHFKNPQADDLDNLKQKLRMAEQIWNSHAVVLDFKYSFEFEIVENQSQAHFSVQLLNDTRGPYDTNWNRNWSAISIAHEVGHMLGLGDEYQTLTSVSDCLPQSIMCESFRADPMWLHYYFILRRLMK